jgi:hypothetical protein
MFPVAGFIRQQGMNDKLNQLAIPRGLATGAFIFFHAVSLKESVPVYA